MRECRIECLSTDMCLPILASDRLTGFGIAFGICTGIWALGTCCWRYRCNRRYYKAIRKQAELEAAEAALRANEAVSGRPKSWLSTQAAARLSAVRGPARRPPPAAPQAPPHKRRHRHATPTQPAPPTPQATRSVAAISEHTMLRRSEKYGFGFLSLKSMSLKPAPTRPQITPMTTK